NENNPYALKEMVEDLLEVIRRGLWDAPDDIVQELTELYLDCEGNLEEINHKG
ncbi:MAG: cobaltochelatase subunit CobN, partial [Candidatus Methanomethylophilaceae archaeon]|nr:cobaltochelatase subunit CobN [Candidatus Methanomethylophilaceae archaeon]